MKRQTLTVKEVEETLIHSNQYLKEIQDIMEEYNGVRLFIDLPPCIQNQIVENIVSLVDIMSILSNRISKDRRNRL